MGDYLRADASERFQLNSWREFSTQQQQQQQQQQPTTFDFDSIAEFALESISSEEQHVQD